MPKLGKIAKKPIVFVLTLAAATVLCAADFTNTQVSVGVAKIDITPELPIRLTGYRARQTETGRIERRLYARALAIGADDEKPVVLITVELIGISREITDAVTAGLQQRHHIERERLAICATHVHTGPALRDILPFMFSADLPSGQSARIAQYTEGLRDKLLQVATAALSDRRPCQLGWTEGIAHFATQRRKVVNGAWVDFGVVPEGVTDRAMPLLRVVDQRGEIRAVFVSYACHNTTLGPADNFVHSDWAGDAAARIEASHVGAVALLALGCGADANPNPRGRLEDVAPHGNEIATEVERLLVAPLRPLGIVTAASYREIELPLDHVVTREELQVRVAKAPKLTITYAASQFIQQIDAGRRLPHIVPYPVQTWSFGDALAMIFLGGEVVADYSLRLRKELHASRLWVNAYANDVSCYIASKRMFQEGGYEVDGAMDYYGWPTRLSIHTEDLIIGTIHDLLPPGFDQRRAAGKNSEGSP